MATNEAAHHGPLSALEALADQRGHARELKSFKVDAYLGADRKPGEPASNRNELSTSKNLRAGSHLVEGTEELTEETTLGQLEDMLLPLVFGPPESGARVDMTPGENATRYRFRLADACANGWEDAGPKTFGAFEGQGLRITYLPGDAGCPHWNVPAVVPLEHLGWLTAFAKKSAPRVLVDPVVDPLDPLYDHGLWKEALLGRPFPLEARRARAQHVLVEKIGEGAPDYIHT
mmetsp:Transcript_38003/g.119955  ORF Transcript_38003/g.119955 Transcript_38003/m.119955 type:complete len:232 (-) Transcript_38003:2896-3591(-)